MQANTDVLTNEVQGLPVDWEETRCWARQRLQDAGKAAVGIAAFLALAGLVQYALFQALENWTVTQMGPAVVGVF